MSKRSSESSSDIKESLSLPIAELRKKMGADEQGLTEKEAAARLEEQGPNRVVSARRENWAIDILRLEFKVMPIHLFEKLDNVNSRDRSSKARLFNQNVVKNLEEFKGRLGSSRTAHKLSVHVFCWKRLKVIKRVDLECMQHEASKVFLKRKDLRYFQAVTHVAVNPRHRRIGLRVKPRELCICNSGHEALEGDKNLKLGQSIQLVSQ